jgi:hypothetical protein
LNKIRFQNQRFGQIEKFCARAKAEDVC